MRLGLAASIAVARVLGERLECVLAGERLVQRVPEGQLERPSVPAVRQLGKPRLDPGVAQGPTRRPGQQSEEIACRHSRPCALALCVLERAVDGNPAWQRTFRLELAEYRRLAGSAIPLEEDDVRVGVCPHLPPDAFDDVGAAEEHLLAVYGAPDDVRTGSQVARLHGLACGAHRQLDLLFVADRGSVQAARLP